MFRDGERYIDYVLAYADLKDEHDTAKRDAFHKALEDDHGLELEHEDKKVLTDDLNHWLCELQSLFWDKSVD